MIRRVIDFSLDNRLIVLIGWTLVVALGLRAMLQIPIDAVPDVTNVQVQILTNSPGLAPKELESFVTFPVEAAMSGLPRISQVRSVSKFGLSVVTVVFEEGTDIYWARQLVGERLADAREQIPAGYGEPFMGPISSGLGEIYQFEVRGEGYSKMDLREILDWTVNYQLRAVPGVVEVNSFGGDLRTYQVTLDPLKLNARGVSLKRVFAAIGENNRNVGGGYIAHAGEQYLIRGQGMVENLDDLAHIVVKKDARGTPVYLKHLGEIEFQPMLRQGAVTRDGRGEAVVGIVMMLMGANSRTVSRDVHAKIGEIAENLPPGVTIDTFYNRTLLVNRTIRTVATNLIEGGVLVVLVLLLLLGSLRGGLIVSAAIPLSMLFALIPMHATELSGNLMSLGAIDFGIIVDGAVVMIEGIVAYIVLTRDDSSIPHIEKVRAACHRVGRPVVFAVSIIAVVYLPILALRGIEGKMFRPMALTMAYAMAGSLVCALTLMPVLASFLLKKPLEKEPLLFRWAKRAYAPLLAASMRRPRITSMVALSIFAGSLALAPLLGAEFVPKLDEGAIAMQVWRLPSISLETSNEISTEAERIVMDFPEVRTVISRTGRAEIATDPMGVEISDTYIMLEPEDTWRFESKELLIEALDEALIEALPGVMFSYSQPIELRVDELISGVRSEVGIKIFASSGSLQDMRRTAEQIAEVVRGVRGMEEVKVEQISGLPTATIDVDREAIARHGVNASDVLDVVETIGGKQLGVVVEGQRRFALQARFAPHVRQDIAALSRLPVSLPADESGSAAWVPLGQLTSIEVKTGPAQISREQLQRKITVELNVRGRDLASAVAEAREAVAEKVDLPPGWFVEWGGQFENLAAASRRLALLVPLGLLLIFSLLYTTFRSARLSFLIFLNVPVALTGGIIALWLRGYPFSISAGVGFIALFGIAVMNGVVLVSTIVQHRNDGEEIVQAARGGAQSRLRPVLMTGLTDVIGFLPMAIATSAGAEVQQPLATVVIGGLATSMLLTLFVIPSVYRWFDAGHGSRRSR
ncbi:MAG: CusA/CzcA family heavy metal efflux RND transporter [bacterium]|jgi:cobalt-zinc-cadmium resistance protein CzcA|nr:efflux RND transporter permease subunit [Planctomycetota bacterium]HIL53183.1 efflux RND transporter permease subunit [Planctomycetota bacterium]